jgi:hypothetical protein
MKEEIICQKRGCKDKVNWIVMSSSHFEKGKPDLIDLLQKPIGFCTTDHIVQFFRDEFSNWCSYRRYKRRKVK